MGGQKKQERAEAVAPVHDQGKTMRTGRLHRRWSRVGRVHAVRTRAEIQSLGLFLCLRLCHRLRRRR
ncbi:hypothetical protein HPP92_002280 [Vanilla planifolia]|uniref:Uncharacterized protein n=1 Tax=Vanilla planifolia TaxID=51239 RepID=A0A835VEC9_VANPL|nr:hypothetical protein HPP92_002280 [Vanilla planifolia]